MASLIMGIIAAVDGQAAQVIALALLRIEAFLQELLLRFLG
jgi:hypothetical protein